ncbi:hypothetical protein [Chryseobacterium shigense]|uniref:Uncharacterized protein n=1 Tax=Chryseobacterium shigense TaxID=297244 RepID=A0A841NIW0_9FLAO|nr:hypothetical protein [Chryseobacterium shigense]MBB6371189.1 hypothetical protein [Chryseobacterium shigense]
MIQLILLLFGLSSAGNLNNTTADYSNQAQIAGSVQQNMQDTGGETGQTPPPRK